MASTTIKNMKMTSITIIKGINKKVNGAWACSVMIILVMVNIGSKIISRISIRRVGGVVGLRMDTANSHKQVTGQVNINSMEMVMAMDSTKASSSIWDSSSLWISRIWIIRWIIGNNNKWWCNNTLKWIMEWLIMGTNNNKIIWWWPSNNINNNSQFINSRCNSNPYLKIILANQISIRMQNHFSQIFEVCEV